MLSKSNYRKNILHIAAGTTLSQAIIIFSMPILTRFYEPSAFGLLALFTAIHTILTCIFTMKYDLSILVAEDNEGQTLVHLTLIVALFAVMLLTIFLAMGLIFKFERIKSIFLFLPLSIMSATILTCIQQWSARKNTFKELSKSQIINSMSNILISLAMASLIMRAEDGLIFGYVLGMIAGLVFLYLKKQFDFETGMYSSRKFNIKKIVTVAQKYRRFPLYVLPAVLIQTLATSLQPIVLQYFFSLDEVGYYAVAYRMLLIPSTLIGAAVAEAFRAEFVRKKKNGENIAKLFIDTLRKMVTYGLPTYFMLYLLAPIVFKILFGVEFYASGIIAQYLTLGAFAYFISQPFYYVFIATDKLRTGLIVQLLVTFIPTLGLIYGGIHGQPSWSYLAWSVSMLVAALILIGKAHRSTLNQ
ncbi:oligosaccharide flippase family protein [Rheinheimera sp.]|uniref:oligosaccharide flippase family protein n=1 Tax=Rheinheimera sp. TaxID=1869214 RepID=UPI004047CD53